MNRKIPIFLSLIAAFTLLVTAHGDRRFRDAAAASLPVAHAQESPLPGQASAQSQSPLRPTTSSASSSPLQTPHTVAPQSPLHSPDALAGTRWRLTRYRSASGEMAAAATDVDAVLSFLDGAASGQSGCNAFFGRYEVDAAANALRFGELGASADACPDTFAAQESGLLAALSDTATFALTSGDSEETDGPTLSLYDGFGRVVAEFAAAELPALVGPVWTATGYDDGGGGFAPVMGGTEITAEFGDDGMLRGNAGCNNYRSPYTVSVTAPAIVSPLTVPDADSGGDAPVEIGPINATRMACSRPDGVMQQEQAYLSALAAATHFRLGIDSLELRSDDGTRSALFALQHGSGIAAGLCNAQTLGNLDYALDIRAPDAGVLSAAAALVALQQGVYNDEAHSLVVELLPDTIVCGDVTGDGQDDALVLLSARTGGTGVFVYLAVVSMDMASGEAANIASVLLGDRVKVHSVSVGGAESGASGGHAPIVVEMIAQGPDDAMCCPTQEAVRVYQVVEGELTKMDDSIVDGLTEVKLANMAYTVPQTETGSALLERGLYREPSAPESSLQPVVALLPESIAWGEIDGVPSAALVLMSQPGSGTFYHLALVQLVDGKAVHVASALLGDRILLNSVAMENDEVVVDMVTRGPDDPECCPSTRVIHTYALEDGEMALRSRVERSRLDEVEAELVGPVWQWQGSQYNDDTEATPDDPSRYTLQFAGDGRVAARVDCNRAAGSYTVDEAALTVELRALTRAACPPGSLEQAFLRDLNGVRLHFFRDGDLYLDIQLDAGTMQFRAAP